MKRVSLTKGFFALVDDEDYGRVVTFKWYAQPRPASHLVYVCRSIRLPKRGVVLLHRWLLDAPSGVEVDHIDGDPLNNQRSNLRFATRAQQLQNAHPRRQLSGRTSPYKGVYLQRDRFRRRPWRAQVAVDGVHKHIGYFSTPEDAARAYNEAARKYFGEFAKLNEIPT